VRQPVSDASTLCVLTASPEETEALGERLAAALPQPAERAVIVYLSGELGAGKSTLARGFVRARGARTPVRSPSYTLVERHEGADLTLIHVDLYRLSGASELETLGLRDLLLPGHVWLVEWPERAMGALPAADLRVELAAEAHQHTVNLIAHSPLGGAWLTRMVELSAA
jgi:tRNA threonylcarbamoyladenosine biosynthesis protein TsaE